MGKEGRKNYQIHFIISGMPKETTISIKASAWPDWQELWHYRELVIALAKRDLKIRYRETVLGIIWVILQPAIVTTIFSVIFGKIAKLPTNGLPYPVFSYLGIITWNFFSSGVLAVSNSLWSAAGMVQKVRFPHLVLPVVAVATVTVDFFVSLIPLALLLFYFGIVPSLTFFLFLPVLVILVEAAAMGLGMFLAPVNVRFRDVRFLLTFVMQIGLFVTPVIYPLSAVSGYQQVVLALNPLAGIIETLRVLLLPAGQINTPLFLTSALVSLTLFIFGVIYFGKNEKQVIELM